MSTEIPSYYQRAIETQDAHAKKIARETQTPSKIGGIDKANIFKRFMGSTKKTLAHQRMADRIRSEWDIPPKYPHAKKVY